MTLENDKQAFRVGLTGGIASGKSTVADLFAELGVPIIDTDVIARQIVQPGEPALHEIRDQFGDAIIDESGDLNRIAMRKLVFADENRRRRLEAILHPRIGAETRRQSDVAIGPYQVIVVPLLVGSPLLQFVDRVLVVDCSEATQISRLLARDSETVEQARKILSAQASRQERLAIADDVLVNESDLEECRKRVKDLHEAYRLLAAASNPPGRVPETP